MKSIILFALICVVAVYAHELTDEEKKKIHEEVESCIAESKVDHQLLDDIRAGKPFVPTRELDCFAACILKKQGVMNEDGSINNNKSDDSEKAKECKTLSGKDACETAGKIMGCFGKNKLIPVGMENHHYLEHHHH